MGVPKTSDHIQINIRMPNPSQEAPASSKAPNEDLKDMGHGCSLHLKNQDESQILEHRCSKDQWPYPNQDQGAEPKSGTSSILQSPKSGLKGHGCSLQLQNQDIGPKFRTWVYQRPVTISKSKSRCQTPVSNILNPPKPQIRTSRTLIFFVLSKSR